jgi:hypothetical protein
VGIFIAQAWQPTTAAASGQLTGEKINEIKSKNRLKMLPPSNWTIADGGVTVGTLPPMTTCYWPPACITVTTLGTFSTTAVSAFDSSRSSSRGQVAQSAAPAMFFRRQPPAGYPRPARSPQLPISELSVLILGTKRTQKHSLLFRSCLVRRVTILQEETCSDETRRTGLA